MVCVCVCVVHGTGETGTGPPRSAAEEGHIRRLHTRLDGVRARAREQRHPALCRQSHLPPARELPQAQERCVRPLPTRRHVSQDVYRAHTALRSRIFLLTPLVLNVRRRRAGFM